MAMTDISSGAGAFASTATEVQARRSQIALYAIYRAAEYLSEGDKENAIRQFKNALAFDSTNATAHTYLGKIYLSQDNYEESIKEFKKVVQNSTTSAEARTNLGNAYMADEQYDNAEKEFKMAAGLDPTDPVADYTLGGMYTQLDRYKEAETQYNKVAKISPNDANVPYSLGALYNKMGRPDDAVEQLQRALTLKKNFPAANYELGAAYYNLGDTEKASEQYDILLSSDTELASDLEFLLDKPRMTSIEEGNNVSFNSQLGAGTPLWMLDPMQLSSPNSSLRVAVAIQFSNEMEYASITNPANWEISKAKNSKGGYYNNTMATGPDEASIPKRPYDITYDPLTRQAKVFFIVNQNSTVDIGSGNAGATIDPSHLVFKFSGVDAAGRKMDTTADQIDGYSIRGF
jgi:tetratricopeptide (TPR) repeat protein